LVGIAGEDDLDAPDLSAAGEPSSEPSTSLANQSVSATGTSSTASASPRPRPFAASPVRAGRRNMATLTDEASVQLRQQLLSELEQVTEIDSLTTWAYRILPLKNQLSNSDADAVEVAFDRKLKFANVETADPSSANGQSIHMEAAADTLVVLGKPVRERNRQHLKFVGTQPCLICGRTPSDAHHLKFAEQRAMGRKVSDRYTVPVCRLHHRELHRRADERPWWRAYGIEPLDIASKLWAQTHVVAISEPSSDVLDDALMMPGPSKENDETNVML
jgi:hypothetical protein